MGEIMICEVGVGTLRIPQHTLQSPAVDFPPPERCLTTSPYPRVLCLLGLSQNLSGYSLTQSIR